MQKLKKKKLIPLALGIFAPLTLTTTRVNASSFGAEIFCTMRDGGNDHESSWDAAYTYIKKQKGGFFKVSPKNAAAQITETVIREREKFSYCVEYLDNLHPNRKLIRDLEKEEKRRKKEAKERENKRKRLEKELEEANKEIPEEFTEETLDRYSY
jgi:cell shape-determining protein MreC